MGIGMEASMEMSPEMRTWVSPSLIEANYILSLSRQELQEVIREEMFANPALEMDEKETCPVCGGVIEGSFCPTCLVSQEAERSETNYEDHPEILTQQSANGVAEDDFDPMTLIASEASLHEQILSDVRTLLEGEEIPIAEWLIENLDERGYLSCSVESVASDLEAPVETIEEVLALVQQVAPVGVAARDVRECLLLQLDYLERNGAAIPPAVQRIIEDHLEDLGAHKYGYIAGVLGIGTDEVEAARDFIRSQLSPFPLQSQEARSWKSPTRAPYVAPDVIISLRDDEFVVEVVEARHFFLRMSPLYEAMSVELGGKAGNGNGNGATAAVSDADKRHIREFSTRAKLFIANIHQRRETLRKIALCLVELQEDFLRGGVRELRPLTRATVAQQVGVHESTVSRATANKYVMLPTRKVIPFSDFFTPSLSVKDVIKEMIVKERAKGHPLTDREICSRLLQQGIRIARRTVAKYRAELGILPSTMR
ncbi:MAG: RNA polymerase factor sigma-54 [Chloroflexota bacterium]|nr:RNA polymerase factor sigma-54 [Chloroflexota bacterium]